jgi:hypothetical protein
MSPSAELRARILETASRQPSPTRSQLRLRNAALLVTGIMVPLVVFFSWGGLRQAARPDLLVWETAGGGAFIALTLCILALKRGRSMLGRTGTALLAVAVLAPLVLFAWKLATSSQFDGMTVEWPTRVGFKCLRLACLTAAWPLVGAIMVRRGTDPTHPRLTGAAIGAAIGSCSWVLVDLWCPVAYVPHLMVGHVFPLVATTVAGAWLGGRLIALRSK